jgi:hypothetical protein
MASVDAHSTRGADCAVQRNYQQPWVVEIHGSSHPVAVNSAATRKHVASVLHHEQYKWEYRYRPGGSGACTHCTKQRKGSEDAMAAANTVMDTRIHGYNYSRE